MHGFEALLRIDYILLAERRLRLWSLFVSVCLSVCFTLALSTREFLLLAYLLHMTNSLQPQLRIRFTTDVRFFVDQNSNSLLELLLVRCSTQMKLAVTNPSSLAFFPQHSPACPSTPIVGMVGPSGSSVGQLMKCLLLYRFKWLNCTYSRKQITGRRA